MEYSVHACPDNNHYHAIDLGLPSGTKWCYCNVGASSPEDYGGYYAWGETSEKSEYTRDNYAFYDKENNKYINIGTDIAGTEYDVAHVRMGGSWRMPTVEQLEELVKHCKWQWTELNGVKGQLATGPNGGQIFLPAAGCRWSDDLYDAGFGGYYWSSSLNPYDDYYAYSLYFNSGSWYWGESNRNYGCTVRAVCP